MLEYFGQAPIIVRSSIAARGRRRERVRRQVRERLLRQPGQPRRSGSRRSRRPYVASTHHDEGRRPSTTGCTAGCVEPNEQMAILVHAGVRQATTGPVTSRSVAGIGVLGTCTSGPPRSTGTPGCSASSSASARARSTVPGSTTRGSSPGRPSAPSSCPSRPPATASTRSTCSTSPTTPSCRAPSPTSAASTSRPPGRCSRRRTPTPSAGCATRGVR